MSRNMIYCRSTRVGLGRNRGGVTWLRLVSCWLQWNGFLFGLAALPAHAVQLEWVRQLGTPANDISNAVSADGLPLLEV
jgi:hypothetical protein